MFMCEVNFQPRPEFVALVSILNCPQCKASENNIITYYYIFFLAPLGRYSRRQETVIQIRMQQTQGDR